MKKVLFSIFTVILLTCVVALSCKKDEKESAGTKAAKEMCKCDKMPEGSEEALACGLKVMVDNLQYIGIGDDGEVVFKDKKFEEDYQKELENCK
jgi:hypothetical protein